MRENFKRKKAGGDKLRADITILEVDCRQRQATTMVKRITSIEFVPAIYPRQIELGKIYEARKEVIENIMESERMIHIYTRTCGVEYGTPISIYKADVEKVIYQ